MGDARKSAKSEPNRELAEAFAQIADNRLETLREMKDRQIEYLSLLQQEARRLRRKLGDAHSRVQGLEARVKHNLNLARSLEIQFEVARIHPVEVKEDDALIHGRVVDSNRRGVPGLIVHGEDESGKSIWLLGQAETDASGYFALPIGPEKIAQLEKEGTQNVFLAVTTHTGDLLFRKTQPVGIAKGARVQEEIPLTRQKLWPDQHQNGPEQENA